MLFCINTYGSIAQVKAKNDSPINKIKADSLKRLITGTPDDTLKVLRLIEISHLQGGLEEPSITFALKALSLAKKLHFSKGIASAYHLIGVNYEERNDYKTAVKYYLKAIGLSETDPYSANSSNFYATLLNLYFYLADYPKALETINREIRVAEKLNNKRRIAHSNNILGWIYYKQENFNEAVKYYNLYINNAKELKDSVLLAHALGEVADVYIRKKDVVQSKNALFTVIEICDNLLVNPGNQDVNQINAGAVKYKGKALYRLGKTYKLTGELQKALKYSLEAITFATINSTTKYDLASYYINAGDVYREMKEFKKALPYLAYGLNVSKEIQHTENTMNAAESLYQTYALQHKYDSAFFFYKLFVGIKDSTINSETKANIAAIQGRFDVEKKDKEIARQQQIRNILIGCFIFILILIILLYNSYRLTQKNKDQLTYNRQQNELFNAIVSTQDKERTRIAQDIHDSLGSVLSAAKLKLSSLEDSKKQFSGDQLEKYETTLSLLNEASTELRNISHNIMPATLSKLGLVAAIRNLVDKISTNTGLHISFTAYKLEERLEKSVEVSIYRIILELINNIVKHATATKSSIQLVRYPAYINLMVEDDGKGFNKEEVSDEKKGIGLGNILSRVEYLKGTMVIDSSPGKGTTFIIEIPYKS